MIIPIKKILLPLTIFFLFSSNIISQDKVWSKKQIEFLESHDLSHEDHRGVLFINKNCMSKDDPRLINPDYTAKNEKEGVQLFFNSGMKKDLTIILVQDFTDNSLCGNTHDIWKITNIFLQ